MVGGGGGCGWWQPATSMAISIWCECWDPEVLRHVTEVEVDLPDQVDGGGRGRHGLEREWLS